MTTKTGIRSDRGFLPLNAYAHSGLPGAGNPEKVQSTPITGQRKKITRWNVKRTIYLALS